MFGIKNSRGISWITLEIGNEVFPVPKKKKKIFLQDLSPVKFEKFVDSDILYAKVYPEIHAWNMRLEMTKKKVLKSFYPKMITILR